MNDPHLNAVATESGRATTRALLLGYGGDPDGDPNGRVGWRLAMGIAIDFSNDDAGLVQLARALEATAPTLVELENLRMFIQTAVAEARAGPVVQFLCGMREQLEGQAVASTGATVSTTHELRVA